MNYPVSEVVPELLEKLHRTPQVLLQAPPGAGKSTWLPLQLLQCDWLSGKVIMLEPRRLAARNVALRLAQQLGQPIGQTIGYRMRAEQCVSAQTRLEVVTEGVLTRMLQQDPLLEGVSLVIIDEHHERSLQADLALALLLDIQSGLRDDLRLLIMSATLATQGLETLLPQAQIVQSAGRTYPVLREYHPLIAHQPIENAVVAAISQMLKQYSGSMLVFLPGIAEIRRVQQQLTGNLPTDVNLCALYGGLSLAEQQTAILPAPLGQTKVVLATNIAETSLTIEGITLIIDSGLERVNSFDSKTGLTRLLTQRIAKTSMTQRAGRAGRLSAGICWHLVSSEQAQRAAEFAAPEIEQAELTSFYLELLHWGCTDIAQLSLLTPPPIKAFNSAKQLLKQLNAIDEHQQLTSQGRKMAQLGCDPRYAAMLVYASQQNSDAIATAARLVAILEDPPRSNNSNIDDWLSVENQTWQRRAQQLMLRLGDRSGQIDRSCLAELLAVAFPDRIAQQRGHQGHYLLANGAGAMLDSDDPMSRHDWLIALVVQHVGQNSNAKIRLAVGCDPQSLITVHPMLQHNATTIEWDQAQGTLRASERQLIGQIILSQRPLAKPSQQQIHQALLNWVREQGLERLPWDDSALQLRARILCAGRWLDDKQWPCVSDQQLLATLEEWLLPALTSVYDVKTLQQISLSTALASILNWQQKQQLDRLLPTHYRLPTGTLAAIRYDQVADPVLSVRLQEMYGQQQTPLIADGRIRLVLELLSPAHRPLQITRDLAAFWQGAYQEVKKEMKGRYPKHLWPDDPANTKPTNRTKRFS